MNFSRRECACAFVRVLQEIVRMRRTQKHIRKKEEISSVEIIDESVHTQLYFPTNKFEVEYSLRSDYVVQ